MPPAKIFFCYAHEDEALLNKLKTHLRPLQRQNLIDIWYDRNISAGSVWEEDIKKHLNEADIILLLVSPSFIDSDYCYSVELHRAIERHKEGNVRVIPVILEYVYWQFEPLSSLQALPVDAKPIASWSNQNEAFYNVVEGIRKVVKELTLKHSQSSQEALAQQKKIETLQRFVNINTVQRDTVKPLDFAFQRRIPASNIACVTFNSDGQLLASGSSDSSIKIWNPHTGILLRTLTGHSMGVPVGVSSIAFSPDDQLLVSCSDDSLIKLWDSYTGVLVRTLTGHSDMVYSTVISPNSQLLASSSNDRSINLWDFHTGTLLRTLTVPSGGIVSVAFSPDSQLLASGDNGNSIKLWNPYTGKLLRTLTGHSDMVLSVVFSPNGQLLVSGSYDNSIRVWDPYTGTLLHTLIGHSDAARSVAFSSNGQLLASGSYDNSVKLWNSQTGTLLRTLTEHSQRIMSIAFSPNDQLLASGGGSNENAITIWGKK